MGKPGFIAMVVLSFQDLKVRDGKVKMIKIRLVLIFCAFGFHRWIQEGTVITCNRCFTERF